MKIVYMLYFLNFEYFLYFKFSKNTMPVQLVINKYINFSKICFPLPPKGANNSEIYLMMDGS